MKLEELAKAYKINREKRATHYENKPSMHDAWGEKENGCWIGYRYDDEEAGKQWEEVERELEKEESRLLKELKAMNKVEIQNPETIIGGRTTTGYRGKLDGFDVNDLTHLWLSDVLQKGEVMMPYKLTFDGKAIKEDKASKYTIQRIDGKVYWIVNPYDLLAI